MDYEYVKKICDGGHEAVFSINDHIPPPKCPVCNRPYDNRRNPSIKCLKDGSVLETILNPTEEKPAESIDPIRASTNGFEDEQLGMDGNPSTFRTRRRHVLSYSESVADNTPSNRGYADRKDTLGRRLALYSAGYKMPVPDSGDYLGRNNLGQELFCANQLVSRKHAHVSQGRYGIDVYDANSLNGTFFDIGNGREKLKPGETATLKQGDKLWLADQLLVVEIDNDG